MVFVKLIRLLDLHVYGDSKVLIIWENSASALSVLDLEHWCAHNANVKKSFLSINFRHVYREHNMSVDGLSKEVLPLDSGLLSFSKFLEEEDFPKNLECNSKKHLLKDMAIQKQAYI